MKPTMINAGFRLIRLEYNNDKAPNAAERKVLLEYPRLHYELHRLTTEFGEFETKLPAHIEAFESACSVFEQLEPDCKVLHYFFFKPDESPPPGIEIPDSINTKYTNDIIAKAHEVQKLMQPLYNWNDNIHPRYKKWRKEYDDFREKIDAFQDDVHKVCQNWREGTINIAVLDRDEQEFYGYVDGLWKRLKKFSKEYNTIIVSYNEFIKQLQWAFEQVNSVSDKIKSRLKDLPWNPDNINPN